MEGNTNPEPGEQPISRQTKVSGCGASWRVVRAMCCALGGGCAVSCRAGTGQQVGHSSLHHLDAGPPGSIGG